jgi:hypothetical protein
MNDQPQPIRAGAAYLAATEKDPQRREAWVKLRLMADGIVWSGSLLGELLPVMRTTFGHLDEWFRPELADLIPPWQRAIHDLDEVCAEIRRGTAEVRAELADLGFEIPWDRIDAWERLARLVEKDPDPLTVREIYLWAIAWAEREAFRLRLAMQLDAERPSAGSLPSAIAEDLIRADERDPAVALVNGKRVYLGHDTVISKLFWLLARPLGETQSLGTIQRTIDGFETFRDMADSAQAMQRFRKALSRLRGALAEHGADADLAIIKGGTRDDPDYKMVYSRTLPR